MKGSLLLSILALCSGTAMAATVFQLDFSNRGGVQAGWETMGGNSTGTLNGSFPGYTGLSESNDWW
jgi:hypothetical protein